MCVCVCWGGGGHAPLNHSISKNKTTFTESKLSLSSLAMLKSKKLIYVNLCQKNINGLVFFLQYLHAQSKEWDCGSLTIHVKYWCEMQEQKNININD